MKGLRIAFRSGILLLMIVVFGLQAQAQTKTLYPNTRVSDNINGYYEYLPLHYFTSPEKRFPLLIYFHGLGTAGPGTPETITYLVTAGWGTPPNRTWRSPGYFNFPSSFELDGVSYEFILFTPQFELEPLNAGFSAVPDVNAIINYCIEHYRVDPTRIYLAGQSGGGAYVMDYISSSSENANKIAAALATSAAMGSTAARAQVIAAADIPVWIAAGEPDNLGNFAGIARGWINSINNAPNPPEHLSKYTILPNDNPTNHNLAAVYLYNPSTTENGLNAYQWLLQYQRLQGPLPVQGLELTAKKEHHDIVLNWSTTSEKNNEGFHIERSADGTQFQSIGYIPSGSDNSSGATYSFTDEHPLEGVNYYRIKQVDKDGHSAYSDIVIVNSELSAQLKIYPNPVSAMLHLEYEPIFQNAQLQIFDGNGSLVKELRLHGRNTDQINVNVLSKGVYHGRIIKEGRTIQFTFVKN